MPAPEMSAWRPPPEDDDDGEGPAVLAAGVCLTAVGILLWVVGWALS